MEWVPQALVIGCQGVLDVVNMTGKFIKEFAGLKQVGAQVHLYFFFQAEGGIRDLSVTGVQTCALPISPLVVGSTNRVGGEEQRAYCSLLRDFLWVALVQIGAIRTSARASAPARSRSIISI